MACRHRPCRTLPRVRAIRRFTVRTVLPEPIAALGELGINLRWSWHRPTQELFASIDPGRWASTRHDPLKLLGALSPEELEALAADPDFVTRVEEAAANLRDYLTEPRWYQGLSGSPEGNVPRCIAYFSPEYGITEVLPQYSGGLGILAGDHLKSASDLGVPIVGVGLLYRQGYFKQALSREGWQQETYPVLDPNELPLALVREADGTPASVTVGLPGGRMLAAHIWRAQVGGGEHRLQQEMLLGIGGVRALRAWSRLTGDPAPGVYHTNEGHAGFLGLERIRELVAAGAVSFDEALEVVRAGTVFTTHTPVPAGIDRFGRDQIETFLGSDHELSGLPIERILALGAETFPGGDPSVFNMAVIGLRLAQRANGVSRLHGAVSRSMFSGLWPGFDPEEVPITSITNGVHAPTWMDQRIAGLGEKYIGPEVTTEGRHWDQLERIPDEEIWRGRREMRPGLVEDARRRVRLSWLKRGASPAELGWVDSVLDPDVLTIGFARRVPTYKRLTLM